jgi:hypothetical protein
MNSNIAISEGKMNIRNVLCGTTGSSLSSGVAEAGMRWAA